MKQLPTDVHVIITMNNIQVKKNYKPYHVVGVNVIRRASDEFALVARLAILNCLVQLLVGLLLI
jgi:hypothetical protein